MPLLCNRSIGAKNARKTKPMASMRKSFFVPAVVIARSITNAPRHIAASRRRELAVQARKSDVRGEHQKPTLPAQSGSGWHLTTEGFNSSRRGNRRFPGDLVYCESGRTQDWAGRTRHLLQMSGRHA